MLRIDGDGPPQRPDRPLRQAQALPRRPQVGQGGGVGRGRGQHHRTAQHRHRIRRSSQLRQPCAQIAQGLGVGRVEPQRPEGEGDRLLVPVPGAEHGAEVGQRLGKGRPQGKRAPRRGDRRRGHPSLMPRRGEREPRFGGLRDGDGGPPPGTQGVRNASAGPQGVPQHEQAVRRGRGKRHGLPERGHGEVRPHLRSAGAVGETEMEPRQGGSGQQPDGGGQRAPRLGQARGVLQQGPEVEPGRPAVRLPDDGGAQGRFGPPCKAEPAQGDAEVGARFGVLRQQRRGAREGATGLLLPAARLQRHAERGAGRAGRRCQRDGRAQGLRRVFRPAEELEGHAEVEAGLRHRRRLQGHGAKGLRRFRHIPAGHQHRAEVQPAGGVRPQGERLFQPSAGLGEILALVGEQAEPMKGVRIGLVRAALPERRSDGRG